MEVGVKDRVDVDRFICVAQFSTVISSKLHDGQLTFGNWYLDQFHLKVLEYFDQKTRKLSEGLAKKYAPNEEDERRTKIRARAGLGNLGGPITFQDIDVSGEISFGSIKIENGEIKIRAKSLVLIMTLVGSISAGVLNYSDAKSNLSEIHADIAQLIYSVETEDAEIKNHDCKLPSTDKILSEIEGVLSELSRDSE